MKLSLYVPLLGLALLLGACSSSKPASLVTPEPAVRPSTPAPAPEVPSGEATPVAPPATPPVTPPALDLQRLVTEDLRIPYHNASRGRDISIFGRITAPANYRSHRLPLVILSPGFGNNLEFIANQYAAQIARLGFVTYSLEFYGGNRGSRTGGAMTEMSPFTEADDLEAALAHLRQEPFVNADQIFLLGFSQGGVVSALTGIKHPEQVRGLILMNAALVLFDDARQTFGSLDRVAETVTYRGGAVLGRIYFERLFDYDIFGSLATFPKKTLIIHGEQDEVVPLRYAERARDTLPQSELHVIPGGRHTFSSGQNATIYPILARYLQEMTR